jgi:hypothetical protein
MISDLSHDMINPVAGQFVALYLMHLCLMDNSMCGTFAETLKKCFLLKLSNQNTHLFPIIFFMYDWNRRNAAERQRAIQHVKVLFISTYNI